MRDSLLLTGDRDFRIQSPALRLPEEQNAGEELTIDNERFFVAYR